MTCRDGPEQHGAKQDRGGWPLCPCPAPFWSKKPWELGTDCAWAALTQHSGCCWLHLPPLQQSLRLTRRGHLQRTLPSGLKALCVTRGERQRLQAPSQPSPVRGV